MTERTIKIKGLIHNEVCMGTYGLVELELLEIEKEMEALRQLAVISRREQLIAFLREQNKLHYVQIYENDFEFADKLLKAINCL